VIFGEWAQAVRFRRPLAGYVARDDRQVMLQRGRGDLAIGHMEWSARKLPLALQNTPPPSDGSCN